MQNGNHKSNICIKGEKSLACMVTEDVMCMGDLIYSGNLNFWPRSEVSFLSKTCFAESGLWVLEFSALSVTSFPSSFKFRYLVGRCQYYLWLYSFHGKHLSSVPISRFEVL